MGGSSGRISSIEPTDLKQVKFHLDVELRIDTRMYMIPSHHVVPFVFVGLLVPHVASMPVIYLSHSGGHEVLSLELDGNESTLLALCEGKVELLGILLSVCLPYAVEMSVIFAFISTQCLNYL